MSISEQLDPARDWDRMERLILTLRVNRLEAENDAYAAAIAAGEEVMQEMLAEHEAEIEALMDWNDLIEMEKK